MRRIALRPRAADDLDAIAAFTEERWGALQRRRYLSMIGERLKTLAANPELGRTRDELGLSCRSLRVGRHVIYYRDDQDRIDVLRILHDAMDPSLHVLRI